MHTTDDGRLVIPYRNPDGSPLMGADGKPWIRWRLHQADIDRDPDGGKYCSRQGSGCRVYHPVNSPNHAARLEAIRVPLRITEGELKGEACAVHDPKRVTVAIGEVDAWRDRRSGTSAPIPELEAIPVKGREVRLCFDSDLDKPRVRSALTELGKYLHKRGASVLLERLPNAHKPNRKGEIERLGADDLIHRYGPQAFLSIAAIAERCIKEVAKEGEISYGFSIPYHPEPTGREATFVRAVYLTALLGRWWRVDDEASTGWWRWTGTQWQQVDGDDRLNTEIETFLHCQDWRQARDRGAVMGIRAAFRRQVGILQPAPLHGAVPCRNGILLLEGNTLLPHAPENGNTWALPIDWRPSATAEPVERFLLEVLGDADSVAIVRAAAQGMLTGLRRKVFIELHGVADSGKSVVARLLQALAGAGNYAAMDLEKFEDRRERFVTYKLRGKRLAVFNEAQQYSGPLENLKAATGGDLIAAERKGSTAEVDFYFRGLVVVVGNGPIRASDTSDGVLARRRSIYAGTAVPPERQRPMLEPDGAGGWTGELASHLPGLLRWALSMPEAEAQAALARNVATPARIESEVATLLESDALAAWAEANLIFDPEAPPARVGAVGGDPAEFLLPHYRREVEGTAAAPSAARTSSTAW
ncbi:DUF5906 domain-containing protein [Cyanobium sp. Copco_Reservoir_LC18]|uniref:DUF5906 domain-containing protein n=1 Tax=Cyanobium sp. Copco_Reservoir_LC18 TaxID=1328305 RepID=UPI00135948DD|nr:DUF5906 domain-containing protein [Cyanobium sp. Copco_Reservoir_LC18]